MKWCGHYATDCNGKRIFSRVEREGDGWGVTVFHGWRPATAIRRHIYETRSQARDGDISDGIGERGRIK